MEMHESKQKMPVPDFTLKPKILISAERHMNILEKEVLSSNIERMVK